MSNRIVRLGTKKVGIGRLAVPLWGAAIGIAVVGVAAGQAVGPVLSGSTSGSVNLTVSQAIVLDTDLALGANPAATGDDSVSTRNDEGTSFTAAIELHTGETETVTLYLQNMSGADAAANLQLNVPAGVDVEVEEISNGTLSDGTIVDEAMLNQNTWLLTVGSAAGAGDDDGLQITIEPKDDIKPGFYTISGRLVQSAG